MGLWFLLSLVPTVARGGQVGDWPTCERIGREVFGTVYAAPRVDGAGSAFELVRVSRPVPGSEPTQQWVGAPSADMALCVGDRVETWHDAGLTVNRVNKLGVMDIEGGAVVVLDKQPRQLRGFVNYMLRDPVPSRISLQFVVWAGAEKYHSPGSTFRIGVEPSDDGCLLSSRSTITMFPGGHISVTRSGIGPRPARTHEVIGGQTVSTVRGDFVVGTDPAADAALAERRLAMMEVPARELSAEDGDTGAGEQIETALCDTTPCGLPNEADADLELPEQLERYRRECNREDEASCTNLGVAYSTGDGVEQNAFLAHDLYARACDLGSAVGCNNLGALFEAGRLGEPDVVTASELYERACEHRSRAGCANLGTLFERGLVVEQSYRTARWRYKQSCRAGWGAGCTNLGAMYQNGRGVPQNLSRARLLYRLACMNGFDDGCARLSSLRQPRRRQRAAIENSSE
jgi:TPR repeat protein